MKRLPPHPPPQKHQPPNQPPNSKTPNKTQTKPYHGANELLLSDHADECSAATVLSRCKVTTLADYQKMGRIVAGTFYSRFAYRPSTRDFDPARVPMCACCFGWVF
jgi:hypothetical protein